MSKALRGWRKVAIAAWRPPNDPTTYGLLEVDATACRAYLDKLRDATGERVTLMSLIIKAAAHALVQEPAARQRLRFGRLVERKTLDIFAQVDRGSGADLSGVKIVDVPGKRIAAVAAELSRRAASVRAHESDEALRASTLVTDRIPGWLLPIALKIQGWLANDLQIDARWMGIHADPFGVAMITNVGSLGLDIALPPIPPICRCLLVCAVGQVRDRAWVVEGDLAVRPILTLGFALDHRYVDGAHAARLADNFVQALKDPEGTFGIPTREEVRS